MPIRFEDWRNSKISNPNSDIEILEIRKHVSILSDVMLLRDMVIYSPNKNDFPFKKKQGIEDTITANKLLFIITVDLFEV